MAPVAANTDILIPRVITNVKVSTKTNFLKFAFVILFIIENVELSYNPTIDRYSLAIISDEKVITLGGRLPVNDLLWLKDFVIRKLIGN